MSIMVLNSPAKAFVFIGFPVLFPLNFKKKSLSFFNDRGCSLFQRIKVFLRKLQDQTWIYLQLFIYSFGHTHRNRTFTGHYLTKG